MDTVLDDQVTVHLLSIFTPKIGYILFKGLN